MHAEEPEVAKKCGERGLELLNKEYNLYVIAEKLLNISRGFRSSTMKILAIEDAFSPELASARLLFEFSNELANRSHEVNVVTIFPRRYVVSREARRPKSID